MAHYTSAASADWAVGSTWSPTGIPGFGDSATIQAAHTITLSGNQTVGDNTGTALDVAGILNINDNVVLSIIGGMVQEDSSQVNLGVASAIVFQSPTDPMICGVPGRAPLDVVQYIWF